MIDSFDKESRNLLENISFEINKSPIVPFNYQSDNIFVTYEDDRHLFGRGSQNSFRVEELHNVTDNGDSLNEGQSSNSLTDKGDDNQGGGDGNRENDGDFGLKSSESFNDFRCPLPKLLNKNQNIGYVSLGGGKIGVVRNEDETESRKDRKSKEDIIPFIEFTFYIFKKYKIL